MYVGCSGPYVVTCRLVNEGNYDRVAMSNGLEHLYMNQQKTFFNIACGITLDPLAKDVLNFDSPNSLLYIFKSTHLCKTYHALEIFLYAVAFEKVFTHISNTSDLPSVEGFLEWNPNNMCHLIRQLLFTFALAVMVSKLGD